MWARASCKSCVSDPADLYKTIASPALFKPSLWSPSLGGGEVAEMEKRTIEGSTHAERVTLPYRPVASSCGGLSQGSWARGVLDESSERHVCRRPPQSHHPLDAVVLLVGMQSRTKPQAKSVSPCCLESERVPRIFSKALQPFNPIPNPRVSNREHQVSQT